MVSGSASFMSAYILDDFEIDDKSFVRDAYKKAKSAEENCKSGFTSQD